MERTPLTAALLISLALAACRAADSALLEDQRTTPPVVEGRVDTSGWLARSLREPVHIEARDLVLQVGGAVVRVVYLSGELIPAGDYVDLEAAESFDVRVAAVEIVIVETAQVIGAPHRGPPEIYAEFTSLEVRERELVARLGEPTPAVEGESAGRLVLSGGAVRTGHSILFDTTLRLVAKAGGALVIDPERLDTQVEGGFSKQGADGSTTLHLVAPGEA